MLPWVHEPTNGRKMHAVLQQHERAAPEAEQMQEPHFDELLAEISLATPGQMHLG